MLECLRVRPFVDRALFASTRTPTTTDTGAHWLTARTRRVGYHHPPLLAFRAIHCKHGATKRGGVLYGEPEGQASRKRCPIFSFEGCASFRAESCDTTFACTAKGGVDQIKKAQKRDLCRGETHLPQAAPWAIATPAAVWAANTSRGRAENLTGSSKNPHPRRGRGVAAATCLRGKPPRNIQVAAAASPPPVNGITRRYSAAFRRSLGVSGKVSVAMMPAVSPVWCFKIHSSLYVAFRPS